MEAFNQSPTSLKLVAPDRPGSDSRPSESSSNQSTTTPKPVDQEKLPNAAPAPPVLPVSLSDQSTTSPEPVDQEKLPDAAPAHPVLPVPALLVPSLPAADQSTTSPEPVDQEKLPDVAPPVLPVIALPVPDLPVIDRSMTGSESLVDRTLPPVSSPLLSAFDQSATGLEPVGQKPTQGMTGRQRVERPSIYDISASPDSGPSRKQKSTGRPLVPSRRTRSAASSVSSVSTRSSKRVK
jgi:hypothetical protein